MTSTGPSSDDRRPAVEALEGVTRDQWVELAGRTLAASGEARPSEVNGLLDAAALAEPQSPVAPAYRIWAADNLAREGRHALALRAFDVAIEAASAAPRFTVHVDPVRCSLLHKAQVARLAGDPTTAIKTYRDLAAATSDPSEPLYQAGWVAEANGDDEEAARLYSAAAHDRKSTRTDDAAELARRSMRRLEDAATTYRPSARALADVLGRALEAGDVAALERLVSTSHFAVGPAGGHTMFEEPAMLDALFADLIDSRVRVRPKLAGSGGKRYLTTSGWKGEWYRGVVTLLLTLAPKGWQWTAVVLSEPDEAWVERWRPATPQTNQPLPFSLLAPWPSGQSFKAGGLIEYIGQQVAIGAAGSIGGPLLAVALAHNACGFGPRGFYYNQGPTHDEQDAFAIDFTRYERNVPYDNESGGTPVLAAMDGIVVTADAGTSSGDSNSSNTVAIEHADPDVPSDTHRFRSRYMHLAGPFQLRVSVLMPVLTGQRLGVMDDTGNSALDHLHFSIHDRQLSYPNVPYGRSVRPTPLSDTSLGDGDSGRCVMSDNVERFPGLNFQPTLVNLGSVAPGASRTMTVTAKNTTGATVTMSFPASSPNAIFRWSSFHGVITNGAETTFQVSFHPVNNAIQRSTLQITSTALGSPHSLDLLGKGIGGFPTEPDEPPLPTGLEFSPDLVNFGSVTVGSTATRTLTIANSTGASVFVSYPASPSGVFQWSAFSGPIAHGNEHRVEITFHAASGAIARGNLTVTSATVSSPNVIGLLGKGPGGFVTPPTGG